MSRHGTDTSRLAVRSTSMDLKIGQLVRIQSGWQYAGHTGRVIDVVDTRRKPYEVIIHGRDAIGMYPAEALKAVS
jgi:hypothetical protein